MTIRSSLTWALGLIRVRSNQLTILKVTLAATLVLAGSAKFILGHNPRFLLPPTAYYLIAALEFILAGLLFTRFVIPTAFLCTIFFAGGIALALVFSRPCGCLGTLGISGSQGMHLILGGGCGVVACALLLAALSQSRDRTLVLNAIVS